MHKFELETVDCKPLGRVEVARPDWPIGSTIYRGNGNNLRIAGWLDSDDPDDPAVLVVEPVGG